MTLSYKSQNPGKARIFVTFSPFSSRWVSPVLLPDSLFISLLQLSDHAQLEPPCLPPPFPPSFFRNNGVSTTLHHALWIKRSEVPLVSRSSEMTGEACSALTIVVCWVRSVSRVVPGAYGRTPELGWRGRRGAPGGMP